jgi:hypothetical protein
MNIYADRGNIAVLRARLAWRGLDLRVSEHGPGDPVRAGDHDLYYLGGGQDRDQAVVAEDLATAKGDALRRAADAGAAVLAVCGGFQLIGRGYTGTDGSRMPGIGLIDADTHAGPTRLIGNLVIEAELDGDRHTVVGFENHAGRTTLGPALRPLGRVVAGHGNDGASGVEGGVRDRVIGTYLHGPLLPKNPWLADRVLAWALSHRAGREVSLEPLPDHLERAAHDAAVRRAMRPERGDRLIGRR